MKRGVFIERDGVLLKVRVERQHQVGPLTLEEFHVNRSIAPLLTTLRAAGFILIVTTNQPGLSNGRVCRRELDLMHQRLRRELPVDDILVCPHDANDACPCRKPAPGLLIEGGFKWQLMMDQSFVLSDKWQDAGAALRAGCTSLLIRSPWIGSAHHDLVVSSVADAVEKILELENAAHPAFA